LFQFAGTPITFEPSGVYNGFSSAHNIVINQDTGYAYVVGARGPTSCGGGLHMVSLADPTNPAFAGCFSHGETGRRGTGYTHDAQCVTYRGPDSDYRDREICVGANETHISIADVTDKSAPIAVAKADYPFTHYAHQGWLTEDHQYYIQNDELDEANSLDVNRTRTLIWDIVDLDDPILLKEYFAEGTSTDHNLYVKGDFVYQSNYIDGLQVLDISDIMNPINVASFDTHPDNVSRYAGTWSNYPFFRSGAVAVTSSVDGLFMVQPTVAGTSVETEEIIMPEDFVLTTAYPNPFSDRLTISMTVPVTQPLRVVLYDLLGREIDVLFEGIVSGGVVERIDTATPDLPDGQYFYRIEADDFTFTRPITHVK
jgi:choice-of-anchor B domain-containing protein